MKAIFTFILCTFFGWQLAAQCTADAGSDQVLNCTQITFTLNGSSGGGSDFTYLWTTTGGTIVSGATTLTPEVIAAGEYCLTVTDPNNGCFATDCMVVLEDVASPLADAGPDLMLNCNSNSVTLNAQGSTTGPEFTYLWTGNPGSIVSGQNTLNPLVDEAGEYCLIVTNTENGCVASDCVIVTEAFIIPDIGISGDGVIVCNTPTLLTGIGPVGPDFLYQWIGPNGLTTGDTISAEIPGDYCLTVFQISTGCSGNSCITVTGTYTAPSEVLPRALPCEGGTTWVGVENFAGSPAFEISWETVDGNIITGQDSTAILVDEPGTYCATVLNVTNGCTVTDCDTVYEKIHVRLQVPSWQSLCPPFLAEVGVFVVESVPNTDTNYLYVLLDDSLVVNGTPYFGGTHDLVLPIGQEYHIIAWAHNAAGTCVSDTLDQILFENLETDITFDVEAFGCHGMKVTADINIPDGLIFSYTWRDPGFNQLSTSNVVIANDASWYYIEIIDLVQGCIWQDSILIIPDFGEECALIEGNIWRNLASDCQLSAADTPLSGWLVQATGVDTFYATTDNAGYYQMPVNPGSYTVSVLPASIFWEPCGNDFSVNLLNQDDSTTVDFLIKNLSGCTELTVDITTPLLRRCFGSNYFVNYCNIGAEHTTDAYVVVDFDDFLEFNSAAVPYVELGENQYQFNVGDVASGECGSFWMSVTVSCDAVLGQTHCTEAHIFPDTACLPPNPLWTGASLELTAECTDSLRFTVKNIGTAAMSAPLDFVVIEDAVMYMQTPPPGPTLGVSEEFTLVVPANGATWRMEAEQEPYHPVAALPVAVAEGCGTAFSVGLVNQFSLGDSAPFIDTDCTQNIGSYDPNDKQGFPTG